MMTAEASNVLARRGVDAPRFRMVAFGGAGPLLGALLAEELSIDTILIPSHPGALSALGAARADLEGDLVQPVYTMLSELAPGRLAELLNGLETTASAMDRRADRANPAVGHTHRDRGRDAIRWPGLRRDRAARPRMARRRRYRTHPRGLSRGTSRHLRPCKRRRTDLAEGTSRACRRRDAEAAIGTASGADCPAHPARRARFGCSGRPSRPRSSIAPRWVRTKPSPGRPSSTRWTPRPWFRPGWQARRMAAGAFVLERIAPEGKSPQ